MQRIVCMAIWFDYCFSFAFALFINILRCCCLTPSFRMSLTFSASYVYIHLVGGGSDGGIFENKLCQKVCDLSDWLAGLIHSNGNNLAYVH